MTKLPVIFAINNEYVKQLSVVIISILKNSKAVYEFNILYNSITEENKKILKDFIYQFKNASINFINMKKEIENLNLEKYMSRRDDYYHISTETYFRFFIPDLFPQYNKLLYLDSDTLVFDDLEKLFNEDIANVSMGVVRDTVLEFFIEDENIHTKTIPKINYKEYFKEKLKKENTKYFNAGILLLNVKKMRDDKVAKKLWEFTAKESPLEYQDQDVLNAVLEKDIKYIDYKWNTLKDLNWFATQIKKKEKIKYLLSTYKKPSIFHYVGSNKPWLVHDESYNYDFIKEWWKHYKQTPFFNKEELSILKNAIWEQRNLIWKNKNYLIICILDFTILAITKKGRILKFTLFNFITLSIKYKKNLKLENIKSI